MIERTLAIIKPDAFPQHAGEIITMTTLAGLVPVEMKIARVSQMGGHLPTDRWVKPEYRSWADFYYEHRDRPFFSSLVAFMASGPVLVMVLEGDHAISHWRELMGPTDSRKARPDTVRGRFGAPATPAQRAWVQAQENLAVGQTVQAAVDNALAYPMWRNAVHGSDSPEAAQREIAFFFGDA